MTHLRNATLALIAFTLAACSDGGGGSATPPSTAPSAAAPATAPVAAASSAGELTVVSWGGAYTKSQIEAYHKPFAAQHGIHINSVDYNGGIAEVKAQVESGKVVWDVVDMEFPDARRACDEGLLEKIDPAMLPPAPDGTPAAQDFFPGALGDCIVATMVFSHVVAYDKSKFPGHEPSRIADFFNVKDFPGKRGMRKTSPNSNLEFALMADGVPVADVYKVLSTPEGVDRAFAKLDTIKNDIVWWDAGAQPPQLLADGEVTMTWAYNGRIFDAQVAEKKPFEFIWDGQIMLFDGYTIPKGTPHKDLALEFVRFATDTQRGADQARWIAYGPARRSSLPLVSTHAELGIEMKPHMPNLPEHMQNTLWANDAWWAEKQAELNERWVAWLAK